MSNILHLQQMCHLFVQVFDRPKILTITTDTFVNKQTYPSDTNRLNTVTI